MFIQVFIVILWIIGIFIGFFYAMEGPNHENAVIALFFGLPITAVQRHGYMIALFDHYNMGYYPRKLLSFFSDDRSPVKDVVVENSLIRPVEVFINEEIEMEFSLYDGRKSRKGARSDRYCMRCHHEFRYYSKLIVYEKGTLCHYCNLSDKLLNLFLFREVIDQFIILPQELRDSLFCTLHHSCIDPFTLKYKNRILPPEYFQFTPRLPTSFKLTPTLDKWIFIWDPSLIIFVDIKTGHTTIQRNEWRSSKQEKREFPNFNLAMISFFV